MGIGMDLYGLRRTVLLSFPLAIAGSALSAAAPNYGWLMVGQLLIGVGCSPADRKSTRLNSSHLVISYAVFCLKKKKKTQAQHTSQTLSMTPPASTRCQHIAM